MLSSATYARILKRPARVTLALAALLTVGPAGCGAEADTPRRLEIGGHVLAVETAATPETRQRGLMGRESLAPGSGMLFIFESPGIHCFWMHDTVLPLSVVFIDASGRVIGSQDMVPETDTLHCPSTPVLYAIELERGESARLAIAPGMRVKGLPASGRQ